MLYGVHLAFSGTPGARQGMKQTSLYLWYPLFQAQWDRCDRHHHQTWNYVVKGHHLVSIDIYMSSNLYVLFYLIRLLYGNYVYIS